MAATILWLRNDLRLLDNYTMHHAIQLASRDGANGEVWPIVCLDPRAWGERDQLGARRIGPARAKFLLDSVEDLRERLREVHSELLVVVGEPEKVLAHFGACVVVAQDEPAKADRDVQDAVRERIRIVGGELELVWGTTLYHRDDMPFGHNLEALAESRSAFGVMAERAGPVRWPLGSPAKGQLGLWSQLDRHAAELQAAGFQTGLPELSALVGEDGAAWQSDPRGCMEFRGGEGAGLARVREYVWGEEGTYSCDNLEEYFEVRNGLLGRDFSSKWSPWLAVGCISPRFCYWEVVRWEQGDAYMHQYANQLRGGFVWWSGEGSGAEARGECKGSYWMIFELQSRDYMHYMGLKHSGSLFAVEQEQGSLESDARDRFSKWKDGMTGVPIVDAVMRELSATGYASNRARLIVSSVLTRDLGLPYWLGAMHFENACIDHDACINWGYWKGSAGQFGHWADEEQTFGGVRGSDYGSGPAGPDVTGQSDVVGQCLLYDPWGAYIRSWVHELQGIDAPHCFTPWKLPEGIPPPEGGMPALGGYPPQPCFSVLLSAREGEGAPPPSPFWGHADDRVNIQEDGGGLRFLDFDMSKIGGAVDVQGGTVAVRVESLGGGMRGGGAGAMCFGLAPARDSLPLSWGRSCGIGWLASGCITCPRMQDVLVRVAGVGDVSRTGSWGFSVPELKVQKGETIEISAAVVKGEVTLELSRDGVVKATVTGLPVEMVQSKWHFALSGESESITLVRMRL